MVEEEMITTAIQLPASLHKRIKAAAEKDERSMAYIFRKAAEQYLAERESEDAKQESKEPKKK